jgi:hypothetical protein
MNKLRTRTLALRSPWLRNIRYASTERLLTIKSRSEISRLPGAQLLETLAQYLLPPSQTRRGKFSQGLIKQPLAPISFQLQAF